MWGSIYVRDLKINKGLKDDKSEHPKLAHRLTDAKIDKLQQYYGNAICANACNLKVMEDACWAVFYLVLLPQW